MTFNNTYCEVSFDVVRSDSDKICLFMSPSGAGKTFLFNVLIQQLKHDGVCASMINSVMLENLYNNIAALEDICLDEKVQVVILDDADLYLTQDFLDRLMCSGKTVLISLKYDYDFSFSDYGFYRVKYDGDTLVVRRKL